MTAGFDLLAAAGREVAGAQRDRPIGPVAPRAWVEMVGAAAAHRATGLLVRAAESGILALTDEQRAELLELHARRMKHALIAELELLRVDKILSEASIGMRVLKGAATAHLDHPDPALREFEDIDLLVQPTQLPLAVEALADHGYARDLPERVPGADQRFVKDITLMSPSGIEVDLHRTLAPGAFGFAIDLPELWAAADHFVLGGRTLPALGRERRALHAIYGLTVAEERPRLMTAHDLRAVLGGPIDVDWLIGLAERWRSTPLVREAVALAERWTGPLETTQDLSARAAQRRAGLWGRLARRSYRSAGGSNTSTLLFGAAGIDRWTDRAAYLRTLILPSREYRQARARAHRSNEWRTGISELLRRR